MNPPHTHTSTHVRTYTRTYACMYEPVVTGVPTIPDEVVPIRKLWIHSDAVRCLPNQIQHPIDEGDAVDQDTCNSNWQCLQPLITWETVVVYGNVIQSENLTGGAKPPQKPPRRRIGRSSGSGIRRQVGRPPNPMTNARSDDERPIRRRTPDPTTWGGLGGRSPPS